MQPQNLGNAVVYVGPSGGGGPAPASEQVGDVGLRNLNRRGELARRALQLAEAPAHQQPHLDRLLQRRSSGHAADSFGWRQEGPRRASAGRGRGPEPKYSQLAGSAVVGRVSNSIVPRT